MSDKEKTDTEEKNAFALEPEQMRNIDFQVDTLKANEKDSAGHDNAFAYFSPNEKTITVNYVQGEEQFNNESRGDATLVHEQKHRDNLSRGMIAYAVNEEYAYKLDMWDEISANMAALVLKRQKYLATGDINVFDADGERFKFYKEAVQKGEINPKSPYKEDFDKEMALIVNGTKNMWQHDFSETYIRQNSVHASDRSEKNGKNKQYYQQNYERGRKVALTIGGVDFTKYLKDDVKIPELAIEERNKKGKISGVLSGKDTKTSNKELAEKYAIPEFDGTMSLQQYQKLVMHSLYLYDKYSADGEEDPIMHRNVKSVIGAGKILCNKEKRKYPDSWKEGFEDFAKSVGERYGDIIDEAVLTAAKKYKSIPVANDKAYNDAVNKLYTFRTDVDATNIVYHGDVNVRDMMAPKDSEEKYFNRKLPAAAKFQEISESEQGRGLYNWMRTCGVDADKAAVYSKNIVSNISSFSKNSFINAAGYAAMYAAAPVFSVEEKCAEGWNKCKEYAEKAKDTCKEYAVKGWNACKNFFTGEEEKSTSNQPIHPVNLNKKTEYRNWEDKDGSRVSAVQYRELPDLTQNIIRQPTKSRAEERAKTKKKLLTDREMADFKTKVIQKGKQVAQKKIMETTVVPNDATKVNRPDIPYTIRRNRSYGE